jgi:hypothetical protein
MTQRLNIVHIANEKRFNKIKSPLNNISKLMKNSKTYAYTPDLGGYPQLETISNAEIPAIWRVAQCYLQS